MLQRGKHVLGLSYERRPILEVTEATVEASSSTSRIDSSYSAYLCLRLSFVGTSAKQALASFLVKAFGQMTRIGTVKGR